MATELPTTPPLLLKATSSYWAEAGRNLVLVPIFPLCGSLLLDQTGVSASLVQSGLIPQSILGEGFGHVGLCFSIHYLAAALQCVWRALQLKRP